MRSESELSDIGRQIRFWRSKRGMSQLELATAAETTPRYVSFVETGRSRPGKSVLLRIANAMSLSARETNAMLRRAGFSAVHSEHAFDSAAVEPFRAAMFAVLSKHEPFPGCAFNSVGEVVLANEAFKRFAPDALTTSPEERITRLFNPDGELRAMFENWEEVVWSILDRQKREYASTNHPRIAAQIEIGERLLKDVPRLTESGSEDQIVFSPRIRIGDRTISTFTSIMRFESASDVTLSEVRVELMFPADQVSREFFEQSAANSVSIP